MSLYVFWRAASVPFLARRRRVLFGTGVLLWALFLIGRQYGRHGTGALAAVTEFLGMNWMGTLLLLCLCLLAADVVTGFGFLFRRHAPAVRGWALAAGGLLAAAALFQGIRPPAVRHHEVLLQGLPDEMDGVTIAALSDLHLGSLIGERWLEGRAAQIEALRPDMVLLLGDIFEGHGAGPEGFLALLGRLSAPLGIWAVPGNHEYHRGGGGANGLVESAGIELLRNRWVRIAPGFVLAGVEDLTRSRRRGRKGDHLEEALAGRPEGATVLLSHTPWQYEEAARAGVGLMLSGHTHGGQIWPFGYLVRRVYPLLAGRYEVGGMTAIVTRGAGTWGPRMRLWHPGEILLVTLRAPTVSATKGLR